MDLGIKGKFALVTGGSRGLGKAAAVSLAKEGVNVAICGRTQSDLDEAVEEIKTLGVKSKGFIVDISDLSKLGDVYNTILEKFGAIEILVNNVGGSKVREDFSGTSLEGFKQTFDLNLFGSFEMMKLVTPKMKNKKWGRIINIASIWGREYGGNISYMASKSALISMTKHAAVSLAKHGILVNSIAPGSIAHTKGTWEKFQNENSKDVVDDFISNNLPMGKFGWPEPVGDLVSYLSSDRLGILTGSCIVIDGGQSHSMI